MIYSNQKYDLTQIGGKAGALAKLAGLEVNIPQWFAIGTAGADAKEIEDALNTFANGVKFAVRSSAACEDGAVNSFAGQFESFLNVERQDVLRYIEKVRQSADSKRLESYKNERGIDGAALPGVLVMQMVNADFAGIAFGANPVNGDTKQCVISATAGLGDKLAHGEVNADTYTVRGGEIRQESGVMREGGSVSPNGGGNERQSGVSGQGSVLSEAQVLEIARLCKKVSRFFGRYQDIEWAYENGKLYLLQSRPITAMRKFTVKSGFINIWDNSNIAESYNGITTPLTFSFIRLAYEHVYREMCRMLGVKESKIAENDYIFTHMLGRCDGQVFYNMLSWYKLVAILPGYKTNAKFMEQMMGVKEELPPHVRKLLPNPSDSTVFTAVIKLLRHHLTNEKKVAGFFKLLNATMKTRDLSDLSISELAFYYRELEGKLLKNWEAPVINDFFSMIFYGLLKNAAKNWCSLQDENQINALLRNTGDIISAEPAKRVREMAELLQGNTEIIESLKNDGILEISRKLPLIIKIKADEYLEKFGDRCINELKLESETLNDNPLPLYRAVGNFAVKLSAGEVKTLEDNFSESEILKKAGLKKPLLKWILKHARKTIRNRENLRFERTRVFGAVRSIFKEIGMRFASFGVLENAEDIFYLECAEALNYAEGTGTTQNLRALSNIRKNEYAGFKRLPYDRFETYDCFSLSERHTPQNENEIIVSGGGLTGLGCCPGIVRGRARVITEPSGAVILPGEILVAERTDPGWIMLFPVAAGVLVEYGSLLSHAAIVVREMGIPAVVSVRNLLKAVKTGDLIELDGEKGLVKIIEQ
ncbi:MAG: hypothetical protein LBS21_08870 [Clostridiales bacterium]|nr:hypothetical protein [Clostridiales bacterium]